MEDISADIVLCHSEYAQCVSYKKKTLNGLFLYVFNS